MTTNNGFPDNDEIAEHLGEPLEDVLDINSWRKGDDLGEAYSRIEREVREVIQQEERVGEEIRQRVLPLIRSRKDAPKGAGLYRVNLDQIKWTHQNLLFNGATLGADGTVVAHDTLLLTIGQVGVITVSYLGQAGEIRKQLFRRDLRLDLGNSIDEMIEVLEQRQTRPAPGYSDTRDQLSNLLRRGLMEYAERGILLKTGANKWLMGHGSPVPREMLVGSSTLQLVEASLPILRELILQHQKFVYLPSSTNELLITTLGDSLDPLQFLIVDTLYDQLQGWLAQAHYTLSMGRKVKEFVEEIGPKIVRGVYRASASSPAQVFYAHVEHAQEAALIALADSVLQEHRGFPMLLALADNLCRVSFDPGAFHNVIQQSYAQAGQPFRYLTERETRR